MGDCQWAASERESLERFGARVRNFNRGLCACRPLGCKGCTQWDFWCCLKGKQDASDL